MAAPAAGGIDARSDAPRRGGDVVVALGEAAGEAAALYAHLTGRTLRFANEADDLGLKPGIKAIVALTRQIDDELIERLFGEPGSHYPGLIVAASAGALRRRVLVCAAALAASRPDLPHRVELIPSFALDAITTATHSLLGRNADAAQVRAALGRGDSAVLIHGHGDGIDGDLGPLVLCPADAAWMQRSAGAGAPVCRSTGRCYRNRAEIGSAEHRAVRLDASDIRARALIWSTCIGFPSPRGFIDRSWGAGLQLAESDGVGALLTSWRITVAPAARPVALLDRLMQGDSLGDALRWYNADDRAQQFCLFGDPDLRIAPRAMRAEAAPAVPASRRKPMPLTRSDQASRFIELCLTKARVLQMMPRQAQREQRLLDQARRALGASPAKQDAERRLRRAAVAYAASRGNLRDLWIAHAASITAVDRVACPHCGARAGQLRGDLTHLNVASRVLINCSRCEIVADRAETWQVRATISHSGIDLDGDIGANWFGLVSCASRWPVAPRYRRWPADARGRPARRLRLDGWDWQYPCEVALVIANGLDLAILARTLSARPAAP